MQTAISWHLRKQVGVIACPVYQRLRRFPASQEDKHRDKINKNQNIFYLNLLLFQTKELIAFLFFLIREKLYFQ